VILVDLGLPDGTGLAVIEAAMKYEPAPEILVLSSCKDEASVVTAISAGAGGYVVKDSSGDDLLETVDLLMQGFSPLSPSIARFILRSFRNREPCEPQAVEADYNLTAREQMVLTEITRGSTYKKISQSLDISEASVQSHVKQVYRKLGVHSRSQAMLKVSTPLA
jgi:DNA-binding NarL/FixJ family response regulator